MKYLTLLLLLVSSVCFADVRGGVNNPSMYIEEQDGSPSNVYWKLIFPDNTITDNGDNTASLNVATEAHLTSNYVPYTGAISAVDLNSQSLTTTGTLSAGATTVDSLTTDTGGITLLAGQDIRPSADSTTAINIARADGTDFVTFDTTNKRVGVNCNVVPSGTFSVAGASTDNAYFFYDNADVGDTTDGQSFYVYRRAAEADDYFRIYINQFRNVSLVSSLTADFDANGTFLFNSSASGDVMFFKNAGSGENRNLRQSGYITASGVRKYINWQVEDTYDTFTLTREDTNIGAFTIQMPTLINTYDYDGTPAIGMLTVKGSTNDGSTNILVGRDSDGANVFTVNTNGGFTANSNSTIGSGEAGVDYTLTFDGENNDGVITWMEDEDTFAMACNLKLTDAGSKMGIGVAPSYPFHLQYRVNPSGAAMANYTDWQGDIQNATTAIGVAGYVKNTGATGTSPSHGIGVWGHYEDVATSQCLGIGTEGKVTGYGTGSIYAALAGYARFYNAGGSAPTGRIEGLHIKTDISKSDGGDPIASGVGVGVYVEPLIGGATATKYAFLGHDKVQVSASEGSTDTVYLSRSSSSADIVVEGNDNLTITVPSAQHVIVHDNATSMSPSSSAGVDLGMSSYEWGAIYQKGITVHTPSADQVIDAVGDTILANATYVILNPDGNYTLTSAPTIADGVKGQIIYITLNNAEANSVTVQDQDTLAGSNLQLPFNTITINNRDVLTLLFDGTDWVCQNYQDN